MKVMKKFIILGSLGLLLAGGFIYYNTVGKCTGSDGCTACKNCKYCKHCAKDGGSCGVCKH